MIGKTYSNVYVMGYDKHIIHDKLQARIKATMRDKLQRARVRSRRSDAARIQEDRRCGSMWNAIVVDVIDTAAAMAHESYPSSFDFAAQVWDKSECMEMFR